MEYFILAYISIKQVTYIYENNPGFPYDTLNMAVILQLQAGQQVWVQPFELNLIYGATSGDGIYSWFSGHLVYPL